jgi:hypothetical protein
VNNPDLESEALSAAIFDLVRIDPMPQWRKKRTARRVTTEFLREGNEWTWYVTPTFMGYVSSDHARQALRRWIRFLAKDLLGVHFKIAWVLERTRLGVWHAHALIAVPAGFHLDRDDAVAAWFKADRSAGIIHIRRFDRERFPDADAVDYLANKDWNLTWACPRRAPCRRERGCLQFGGPWF